MSRGEGQDTGHSWHRARGWNPDGRSPSTRVSTAAGLRRVDWVRLVVEHDAVRAEAVGTGYRLPAARPIALSVAAALIAEGTPSITRRVGVRPAAGLDTGR
jgi:hypothetical protein